MRVYTCFARRSQYNPIWQFPFGISGQPCDMSFTSVAGHLMELEFQVRGEPCVMQCAAVLYVFNVIELKRKLLA